MIKTFGYGLLVLIPFACFFGLMVRYPNVTFPLLLVGTVIFITYLVGKLVQIHLELKRKHNV